MTDADAERRLSQESDPVGERHAVMESTDSSILPASVETARTRVAIGFKRIANSHGTYSAHAYQHIGFDNSLRMQDFKSSFSASVVETDGDDMVFDFVGIDAPIANAIRRILLAEVPTVAIETVYVHDNSSIVPDEMLAHRLGLVPLRVDPRKFEMKTNRDDPATPTNTVRMRLTARCDRNPAAPRDGVAAPDKLYLGYRVLSGGIKYVRFEGSDQLSDLGLLDEPAPIHDDIVLAKMRPGERIDVALDAVKGVGKDHAKFSPVATAAYRMLPEIKLHERIHGADAQELKDLCPTDVFDIEDSGCAAVARPRNCTMCRECLRDEKWHGRVELARKRDHFIYTVESAGALPPATIVSEALNILSSKCATLEAALDDVLRLKAAEAADATDATKEEQAAGQAQNPETAQGAGTEDADMTPVDANA